MCSSDCSRIANKNLHVVRYRCNYRKTPYISLPPFLFFYRYFQPNINDILTILTYDCYYQVFSIYLSLIWVYKYISFNTRLKIHKPCIYFMTLCWFFNELNTCSTLIYGCSFFFFSFFYFCIPIFFSSFLYCFVIQILTVKLFLLLLFFGF